MIEKALVFCKQIQKYFGSTFFEILDVLSQYVVKELQITSRQLLEYTK